MVFKLAISYLKKQKSRTLSLAMSISIATILVFSLNVISDSRYESDIKQAYNLYGDYHGYYTNIDNSIVQKIKNEKDLIYFNDVLNFGNLVKKDNGTLINLKSYNKSFLESLNFKIEKGRAPKNSQELLIEEKALKELGLKNDINQEIDFILNNKYIDNNDIHNIHSKEKKFKVVGIISKADAYYEGEEGFDLNGFTFSKDGAGLIPKELINHQGTFKLNSKVIDPNRVQNIAKKYSLTSDQLYPNIEIVENLSMKSMDKGTVPFITQKVFPVICSTIVIYNIFNIIFSDMINQMGIMRAVGLTKKKLKYMFLIQSIILFFVGTIIGLLLGVLFSYFGIMFVYGDNAILDISLDSIKQAILMSMFAVLVSSTNLIYKSSKLSIVDSIRSADKIKEKSNSCIDMFKSKLFSIVFIFSQKNLWRNKWRAILTCFSIFLAGLMFISTQATDKLMDSTQGDILNLDSKSYGNFDLYLGNIYRNSEFLFTNYDNNILEKLKKDKNIIDVKPSIYMMGFLKESLHKDYLDELNRINNLDGTKETNLLIRGYSNSLLKNIDKYVHHGDNIYSENADRNGVDENYKNILLVNNFYSRVKTSNNAYVIKSVNVGDLINIKIPIYKNGLVEYKDQKVRVAGIMDNLYIAEQDGESQSYCAQIIFKEEDLREITDKNNYNKVFIKTKEGKDNEAINSIEKLVENTGVKDVEGKYITKHRFDRDNQIKNKLMLISLTIILFISSLNIVIISRSNITVRLKEISTLMAIGMSKKKVKRMLIYENVMYGLIGTFFSGFVCSIYYYWWISIINKMRLEAYGGGNLINFKPPIFEIMQFGIISCFVCILSVYFFRRKIDNFNIVEVMRGNE